MLIRLSLLKVSKAKPRFCAFLVPAVPLVNQQAEYLRYNCDLVVTEVYGALGVDKWGKQKWEGLVETSDVIVMTPQILLNSLNNAYLGLDSIALIIFDEAHHARKNHPYNHIMEVYRHERDKGVEYVLPKLFGMTASPSASGKGEAAESIRFVHIIANDLGYWKRI